MELIGWAFTDLDDTKKFLGITGTADDDLLVTLINRASSFMDTYTARRLQISSYSSITDEENCWYDGDGTKTVHLKQYPVNSVSSVTSSGASILAASLTDYYGSTGYLLYKLQGQLFYDNGWTVGKKNIRVSYNAGYLATSREWQELQELCRSLVARVYNQRGKYGFRSEALMNYRYTLSDLKDERGGIGSLQQTLDRYRRKIIR